MENIIFTENELVFDATQVEPAGDYSPLPEGDYNAIIVASGMKDTKDHKGKYLNVEMEILEGTFKGRKVWDRLNLVNGSAQAVEIAYKSLSAICHATKKLKIKSSQDLHNIPLCIRVKYKKAVLDEDGNEKYKASNEIAAYKEYSAISNPAKANTPWTAKGQSPPSWTAPSKEAKPDDIPF